MISKLEEQLGTLEVQLSKARRMADFCRRPRLRRAWEKRRDDLIGQVNALKLQLAMPARR